MVCQCESSDCDDAEYDNYSNPKPIIAKDDGFKYDPHRNYQIERLIVAKELAIICEHWPQRRTSALPWRSKLE